MTYQPVERIGVAKIDLAVTTLFGWIFRETPIVDYGIDGQIEYVLNGCPQGRLIAVQIKAGESHLTQTKRGLIFYGELRHLNYWLNHSIPVLLVVYTPRNDTLRWVHITENAVIKTDKSWNIVFPTDQFFDKNSAVEISQLFYSSPRPPELQTFSDTGPGPILGHSQHIKELVYTVAKKIQLPQWHDWICYACCDHLPKLSEDFIDGVRYSAAATVGAIYPSDELGNIQRAIQNMLKSADSAIDILLERAEYLAKWRSWWGIRAYERDYTNKNFNDAKAEHEAWLTRYLSAMQNFVKSVNLFADSVRESLDPDFFLATGKFLYYDDEFARLSDLKPLEYSNEERRSILMKRLA